MALITETGSAYYSGSNLGGYQFTDLQTVINQFMLAYVGEEKIIGRLYFLLKEHYKSLALTRLSLSRH